MVTLKLGHKEDIERAVGLCSQLVRIAAETYSDTASSARSSATYKHTTIQIFTRDSYLMRMRGGETCCERECAAVLGILR
jgi:hypothetical protein